jgi:choline dehydrogenase-like flavoprotein
VVVVGTGAGGAVVAKELTEQGIAVLMVEEGELHQRQDFTRRSMPATQQLYRNAGLTGVIGNSVIPIPARARGGRLDGDQLGHLLPGAGLDPGELADRDGPCSSSRRTPWPRSTRRSRPRSKSRRRAKRREAR